MALEEKIGATIEKYRMLSYGDGLLLGVSGGPDSVALLHVMARLADDSGWRLEVAHLAHGIRKEEGREDAGFVKGMAEDMGLPFHLKEVDLPGMRSEVGRKNLEAMGREERYRFFSYLTETQGLNKVATAHTRDDQGETLFMWLLRGSGRKGMGGMAPVRRLNKAVTGGNSALLIRPMINVSKAEIMVYLSKHGLPYRIDETNFNTHRLRSWVRHSLLPQTRERVDPGLDERLARSAEILRDEEDYLNSLIREKIDQVSRGSSILRVPFLQEVKAVQRRLVRRWLEKTSGDLWGIGFEHVEAVLQLVHQGSPQGRLSLPGGWNLVRNYDVIQLAREDWKWDGSPAYRYVLPRQGELIIPEAGWKLRSSYEASPSIEQPRDDLEALFDTAFLPGELTVRNFRPGDRYQPLGMRGHKKVKDLFIEKKIPFPQRRNLPLLFCGEEILWIPRCGRSEVAKAGPGTKEILKVRLAPLNCA